MKTSQEQQNPHKKPNLEINHVFVPDNFYKDNPEIISKIKNLI